MNEELESIWKETILANFKVLHRYSSEGTEENHETPQESRYLYGILTYRLKKANTSQSVGT